MHSYKVEIKHSASAKWEIVYNLPVDAWGTIITEINKQDNPAKILKSIRIKITSHYIATFNAIRLVDDEKNIISLWSCTGGWSYGKDSIKEYANKSLKPEDQVNHPTHYTSHPSGIECIQITEHMNFNLGNALKYIWRADLKSDAVEDLRKARFYIEREIQLRIK